MKKRVAFWAAGLSVALAGGWYAGHAASLVSGAYGETGAHQDELTFENGSNFTQVRQAWHVPRAYGRLVGVTSQSNKVVLWFEAEDGAIRNVVLDGGAPVVLQRKGELRSGK